MSALVLVLLLSRIVEHAAVDKPVVSFSPPWSKIFSDDSLTIICNTASADQEHGDYVWYKNQVKEGNTEESFTIDKAIRTHSGNYQCKTSHGELSNAVSLSVSYSLLILQAPHAVFEGDDLSLRCHRWGSNKIQQTTFYRNNEKIFYSNTTSSYTEKEINKSSSGNYKCTQELQYVDSTGVHSDEQSVSIQDLFSYPEIRVSPYLVTEGAEVTISCDTTLNLLRADTELQFAFFRNRHKVQDFSSSNEYRVASFHAENSGYYTCEVKTSSGKVQKQSIVSYIQIYSATKPVVTINPPWNKILSGESVTLSCNGASTEQRGHKYVWYKDLKNIEEDKKDVTLMKFNSGDAGNYRCKIDNSAISDAVILYVTFENVALQAPGFIFEGEDLRMRCHTRLGHHVKRITFYLNNTVLLSSEDTDVYYKQGVDMSFHATYSCKVEFVRPALVSIDSSSSVIIQELFSYPEINVSPNPVTAGAEMRILCNTTLNHLRAATELQFAFYRNEHKVQDFGSSNTFRVGSAEMDQSGIYSCEVKTSIDRVRKRSRESNIQIHGKRLLILLISLTASLLVLLLICTFLLFKYRKKLTLSFRNCCLKQPKPGGDCFKSPNGTDLKLENEEKSKQEIPVTDEEEMHNRYEEIKMSTALDTTAETIAREDGVCYASVDFSQRKKASSLPVTENNDNFTTYATVKCAGLQITDA